MSWRHRFQQRRARRAEHRALRHVNATLARRDAEVPPTIDSVLVALALWRRRMA